MVVIGNTLASLICQRCGLIDGVDGEGDRRTAAAFADGAVVVDDGGEVVLRGGAQLSGGVVRDGERLTALLGSIPTIGTCRRSGHGEGRRAAVRLVGQLRCGGDVVNSRGNGYACALTGGVLVVAFHVIVDVVVDSGFILQSRSKRVCSSGILIPTAGGGVVVDSGREGYSAFAATHLVGYGGNSRHGVDDGRDSHALGGATRGAVRQLHVVGVVFGKIVSGEIGVVGYRRCGVLRVIPSEVAAVVASGPKGNGTFTATLHIAQLIERGTCVDGQVQCDGAVAAGCIRNDHRVCAGGGEGAAVEQVGQFIVANRLVDGGSGGFLHGGANQGIAAATFRGGLH